MSATPERSPKITTARLLEKRHEQQPITVVTAYDFPTARLADEAGVDVVLVGDSLAMVVLGHPNTLSVTMDEMLLHARAVSRGAKRPLLIGDMPFMSYQADRAQAVRNAGRFLAEAGMDAVKLEGGRRMAETVRAIVDAGIPVMGHVGLLPQSEKAMGGLRVQARTAEGALALLDDAQALEEAGCFSIVIEGVPARVATEITARLQVPVIGIGAGPGTSGQVLVIHDLIGLSPGGFAPRFVKRYADVASDITGALRAFREDVETRRFPAPEHTYAIPEEEWSAFAAALDKPRPRRILNGRRR
jgi:3-methyl-2-oxobutanoate hydroxymethyltransferase